MRIAAPPLRLLVGALLLIVLCGAAPAHAGTYTVTATCGAWDPVNERPTKFAVYTACPMLVARNVAGHFNTGAGVHAAWVFTAPSGTGIEGALLSGTIVGRNGWQSTIYLQGGNASGAAWENCPSASCPYGGRFLQWAKYHGAGANAIVARVRCGSTNGCYNGEIDGRAELYSAAVTIADYSAPAVSADGPLASPGWKGGTVAVNAVASDNVGVKQTRALVDGVPRAAVSRACNYTSKVPCPNGADVLQVPLGGLSDGQHTLTVQAIDSADNTGGSDRAINVDNTPPVSPEGVAVVGGAGWRAENKWTVQWGNPAQQFAPIAAAEYQLCPPAAESSNPNVAAKARKQCVSGSRTGTAIEKIDDLEVPGPGRWDMRLWLVDAAGNRNPDASVELQGLGFDPSPPANVGFADQAPDDPARLRVAAADPVSGIASGAIEVRRHGRESWRPLGTEVTAGGLTAFMDDEALPKGSYDLRAVAVNGAGLQRATVSRENGNPATLKLPVRMRARLIAGRLVRRCATVRTNRRCTVRAIKRLGARFNRETRIRGRLTSGGKALADQDLEVWRRLAMSNAEWQRIGTVTTGRVGRFSYKAPRGPARLVRFRYPGSAAVRGDNAAVAIRVPARTSIQASRRDVINGEYATFSGHVRGGSIPGEGTLVELQVFTRGRWRTFAQPRASAEDGRWEFQYRFETIRGHVSFRFRARIRRQSNYPFITGHSRSVRVDVRGL